MKNFQSSTRHIIALQVVCLAAILTISYVIAGGKGGKGGSDIILYKNNLIIRGEGGKGKGKGGGGTLFIGGEDHHHKHHEHHGHHEHGFGDHHGFGGHDMGHHHHHHKPQPQPVIIITGGGKGKGKGKGGNGGGGKGKGNKGGMTFEDMMMGNMM